MNRITGRQFQAVLIIELILISTIALIAYSYWHITCDGSLQGCVSTNRHSPSTFFILALLRPIFFSPILVTALIGGANFGIAEGSLLAILGTACSSFIFYTPGRYLGNRLVLPWLRTNLPNTWKSISALDYRLIFLTRWLPIFPFDIMSFLFGVAGFKAGKVFIFSLIGITAEILFFTSLAGLPGEVPVTIAFALLFIFAVTSSLPILILEYINRRKGTSTLARLKRIYYEVFYEVQVNNEIKKKNQFDPNKVPVILIYGFFSSRRTLSVMERLLSHRGYQVMTFNLGGVLGVFFTRGIRETAEFLDRKIKRQIKRHNFEKIYLISHSKGGLVALWWILRMGGSQYCQHVITMGTPFKGTRLTYLALFTPLGFFWKDVWQMRPKSRFLKELHESPPAENVTIYNLYSSKDAVAKNWRGTFEHETRVVKIPMHSFAHFEFLYKRSVADTLVKILNKAEATYALEKEKKLAAERRGRFEIGDVVPDDKNLDKNKNEDAAS